MAIVEQYDSQHFLIDSINILLQSIGELPIETLDDVDNVLEAQLATDTLWESKRNILAVGWDLNTDTEYEMNPETDGTINVLAQILDVTVEGSNIVVRGNKLWDKDNNTPYFDGPVYCTIKWNLDFDTLTHPLRHYITCHAAKKFCMRLTGDTNQYSYWDEEEKKALIAAKQSNGFTGQFNLLSSGSYSSNFNILSR